MVQVHFVAVKNSKMPKGVEHAQTGPPGDRDPGVKNSKMPKGVEHWASQSMAGAQRGEEFEDAERR